MHDNALSPKACINLIRADQLAYIGFAAMLQYLLEEDIFGNRVHRASGERGTSKGDSGETI